MFLLRVRRESLQTTMKPVALNSDRTAEDNCRDPRVCVRACGVWLVILTHVCIGMLRAAVYFKSFLYWLQIIFSTFIF